MSSKPQTAQKVPMAQQQQQQQQRKKMPKLPKNATVTKRPLLRPQIPSKHQNANTQKTIYLSSHTPFMSAIKRTERHLSQVEKRALQSASANLENERRSKKRKLGAYHDDNNDSNDGVGAGIADVAKRVVEEQLLGGGDGVGVCRDEVVVKATGRAIQKALAVGLWFQAREGYGVLVRTGTVRAIDDVEVPEDDGEAVGVENEEGDGGKGEDQSMRDVHEEEGQEVAQEVPETRIRSLSTIEIAVYRK